MAIYNTWLPGNQFFDFNDGVTTALEYKEALSGEQFLCQKFVIPNAQAGFGITYDQADPAFDITKPPKVFYASTAEGYFVLKDSDGWLWRAPLPAQTKAQERGWAWNQFEPHEPQENEGEMPEAPSSGRIEAFQFGGGEGVHGEDNDIPVTIWIGYIAGRPPVKATVGDIRSVVLTDRNPGEHVWKVGTCELENGTRKEIKYLGSLPFGLQLNGPRDRLAVLPYRGPIIAGYQSGTPWVKLGNNTQLGGMLDFMLESQLQFQQRHPQSILGPWMHIYLQALWDCEQNGPIDTWVWDGPDGNPAWDGWQYRALDGMTRTWADAMKTGSTVSTANKTKLQTVCTRFLDWLHTWLKANEDKDGVPNNWNPPGWTQGQPFPASSYLDPKFTFVSGHDNALALKSVVFAAQAGYSQTKSKYMIHRLIEALKTVQVTPTGTSEMRGAFTLNPAGYEVYGFEQGEILEALAVCKQHPELLVQEAAS